MRNLLAALATVIVFTLTVALVNMQWAVPGGDYSFDIALASGRIADMALLQLDQILTEQSVTLPWPVAMGAGAFALSLPALFTCTVLGRG